jgi:hypothetical protein
MKIRRHQLIWALFLLAAGAFLLVKNNGGLRDLGDAIWGGIFTLMGAGFLAWFLIDRGRHWRAIAGFPLLASGALSLLAWRGVSLGDWQAALVLLSLALGFWTVLLTHDDNWWALIPAGVLTLMAVLTGFQARLNEGTWLGIFLLGLGLVFGLLYLLRLGQQDTGWAGIPAAAFCLIGLVTLVSALKLTGLVAQWWPALLLAGGVVMLFLAVNQVSPTAPAETASHAAAASPSAARSDLPAAAPPPPPAPAEEPPVDIYAMLAKQPKEDGAPE